MLKFSSLILISLFLTSCGVQNEKVKSEIMNSSGESITTGSQIHSPKVSKELEVSNKLQSPIRVSEKYELEPIDKIVLKEGISVDELGNILSGKLSLREIDYHSFKQLNIDSKTSNNDINYYKDSKNIYITFCGLGGCSLVILSGVDYEFFEYVGDNYAKDKANVYYGGFKISNVNPENFEVIPWDYIPAGNFAKYNDKLFVWGVYLEGFNANHFMDLTNRYIRDDKNIYYGGDIGGFSKVNGVDLASFEVLKNGIAKDKNFTYTFGVQNK